MIDHGESKFRNRVIFKLTGRWPQSVVDSRVAELDRPLTKDDPRLANVKAILDDVYREAGHANGWPGP